MTLDEKSSDSSDVQQDALASETLTSETEADMTSDREYVGTKLEHGLGRVWGDVQNKVKVFILGCDLSHFNFDQFIQVLNIVHK